MDEKVKANMLHWDDMVEPHVRSEFYDVEGFKKGRNTLDKITLEGVGDVKGKTLLHLQCHFGLDTLSFARLGATVTGIDFSPKAIKYARALAAELGIPATFVRSDVYDLPGQLSGQFDIVFTSQGVLCWLPDLKRWAQVIAHFLKPGGFFFILESHPVAHIFDNDNPKDLIIRYSYFLTEPMRFEGETSYAVSHIETQNPVTYEWMHPFSEIVNSLVSAGLIVEHIREYPFIFDKRFSFLEKSQDGFWRLPDGREDVPLTFTLRAVKPL
ncbi:methyltransferase domain-containing protein [candidate division WOR-3 bacterium]|nr:methyltransferase domain-containing protein [candidate division WOR-3 bacterium]